MSIVELRKNYHRRICEEILTIRLRKGRAKREYPSNADGTNRPSVGIAWRVVEQFDYPRDKIRRDNSVGMDAEKATGGQFEKVTRDFLRDAFALLQHLRPGEWEYHTDLSIASFDQYGHLADIAELMNRARRQDKQLAAMVERVLGKDYIIKPDIVIGRCRVSDDTINKEQKLIGPDDDVARMTPLRRANYAEPRMILHASISCKWTMRSDRAQNTRTEALNLIRNRKGPLPHVVAITAEPLPTRISSLAQGTGDLDCVYHIALSELIKAVDEIGGATQVDTLGTLIRGRRLRDISDLPFDLTI